MRATFVLVVGKRSPYRLSIRADFSEALAAACVRIASCRPDSGHLQHLRVLEAVPENDDAPCCDLEVVS